MIPSNTNIDLLNDLTTASYIMSEKPKYFSLNT